MHNTNPRIKNARKLDESFRCFNFVVRGMTLIEVIIYTVLLSLLITNMINYLYTMHINNIKLINDVQDSQNL